MYYCLISTNFYFSLAVDKEELREVNISKKELNDLVDELFSNLSDVDFDEVNVDYSSKEKLLKTITLQINKYDIIPELFRTTQKGSRSENSNELSRSDEHSDKDDSFEPSEISTPTSRRGRSLVDMSTCTTNGENSSVISFVSNLSSNQSNLLNVTSPTQTLMPINVVNPFQGAAVVNGIIQIPQYQQVMVQIPTIDILKIQARQLEFACNLQSVSGTNQLNSIARSDVTSNDFLSVSARNQYRLFQHLYTDLPLVLVSHAYFLHVPT